MSIYLIAATAAELARNEGMEIMASSTTEAVAKYLSIGGSPEDDMVCIQPSAGPVEEMNVAEFIYPEEEIDEWAVHGEVTNED